MIMCTLLSMVYGLFKLCWLTHVTSQYSLLTLNKYFSVGCEKQVMMFWKHRKQYICFVIKVERAISFSDLSLHRIEINYEQIIVLWIYYEHNMNICFSSKFALGIPSILSSFRSVFWSALLSIFSRDLIFFGVSNRKPI